MYDFEILELESMWLKIKASNITLLCLCYNKHILQHYLLEISDHRKILEAHGFCIKSPNTVDHRTSFSCIACFKSTNVHVQA